MSQISGTNNNDTLAGDQNFSGENDTIFAIGGDDSIDGLGGDDVIRGGSGNDKMNGNDGNDTIIGDPGDDSLDGGSENDSLEGGNGADTLFGATGDDLLFGRGPSAGADYNDLVVDILDGGLGNDTLHAGLGDSLTGGTGADAFIMHRALNFPSGPNLDTVTDFSQAQGDLIDVSDLRITGFSLVQPFLSDLGADTQLSLRFNGQPVGFILSGVADPSNLTAGDFVFSSDVSDDSIVGTVKGDDLFGGLGNDTVGALSGDDMVYGNAGRDSLDGGGGNDTIFGGGGRDVLVGSPDGDDLDGGSGFDTARYVPSVGGVNVDLAAGTGTGGYAEGDMLVRIENITGSVFADSLSGNGGKNVLIGNSADDELSGRGGNDRLFGGSGNDTLDGGDGNDKLVGGGGNDNLAGGAGADSLDGNSGRDTANYSASAAAVTIDLGTGAASGGDAQGDVLARIENVAGSPGSDNLSGSRQATICSATTATIRWMVAMAMIASSAATAPTT